VRPKTLLTWIAGVLVALAAILYAGDFLWFEYRVRNSKSNDPLETVTFYYATAMKNGKVEVFYDQPQTQTCVRSIFPHNGRTPCWRFNRSGIQRISRIFPLERRSEWKRSGGRCGDGHGARAILPYRAHGKEMIVRGYPF